MEAASNQSVESKVDLAGLQKLREPFAPEAISTLPKGGTNLKYVGHAAVTDRLSQADPTWNWEPLAVDPQGLPLFEHNEAGLPIGLWIKLTVCGVTRLGYGTADRGGVDAKKVLIGDALRNAAMRFGVALDLWSKDELESQIVPDWDGVIAGYKKLSVTEAMLVTKLGRPRKKWTTEDYETLIEIGTEIKGGRKVEEFFTTGSVKRPQANVGPTPDDPRASVASSLQPKKTAA